MKPLKLGVRVESLHLPLRRALQEVERLAVPGVQLDAVGDLAPRALSQTGRREFRHLLRSHSLELTALGCPLRHGLDVAEGQEARIEHVQHVMSLAFDLGARTVVASVGQVPEDAASPGAGLLAEALGALGPHGDRIGVVLALDTGPEPGNVLQQFLARFDTGGLGANVNPAQFLLHGLDPYENTVALRGRVTHAHAADARQVGPSRAAREVPLGHGDLDWMQYLATLQEIEYHGWLVVVRETGENRLADVAAGVAFLRRLGV